MSKSNKENRELVYLDGEPYYQIRSNGDNVHWMFIPINKSKKIKKGLHIARDSSTNENRKHFDIFKEGNKLKGKEEYLENGSIAGLVMNNKGKDFVLPSEYIYLWRSNPRRFYTPEKFKELEKQGFVVKSIQQLIDEGFFK